MTKDKAASTEELTDKKRPFWKRPALFVSVLFWIFIWFNYYKEILLLAPITFPTFFVLLFFSVLTLRSAKYKLIGIFFWSAPLTLLLIMTFSQLVSFVIPASFTYYLGIDVMTPRGLKTCQSMVKVDNDYLNNNRFPKFTGNGRKVKGEAVYCDLGDNYNIVVTLVFPTGGSTHQLRELISLTYKDLDVEDRSAYPSTDVRMELKTENIPVLVSFSDPSDPESMQRVFPSKFTEFFGPGYSLRSVWVKKTSNEYVGGEIISKLPWIREADKSGAYKHYEPFKRLGLTSAYKPFERRQ